MADPYVALVSALHNGQLYMYVNVATLTVLVVDYIATLDYELEYMWPFKFNPVSVLFILTRYLPVADMTVTLYTQHATGMTVPLCSLLGRLYVWLIYAGMAIAEALLMLRVWALYGKGRRLTVFLTIVYLGSFAASGAKIYLSLKTLQVAVVSIPGRPAMCFLKSYDQELYLYWVFMIVVDAACVLLLSQLARAYRTGGLTNLMRVVYRDGIIFYLVLLCFSVVNIFAIVTLPTEISSLLTAPERALHAILAARVILSTRHQVCEDRRSTLVLNTIPSFDVGQPEPLMLCFSPTSATTYYMGSYTSPISPSTDASFHTPRLDSPPRTPPRSRNDSSSSKDSSASGPGPIFEAAAEKQRQRQQAKIRRSLRLAQRYEQRQCHWELSRSPEPLEILESPVKDDKGNQSPIFLAIRSGS